MHVYQLPLPGAPELPIDPSVLAAFIATCERTLAEWAKEARSLADVPPLPIARGEGPHMERDGVKQLLAV